MSSKRRRSARPDPARFRLRSNLEALESRQLLTQSPYLAVNDLSAHRYSCRSQNPGIGPARRRSPTRSAPTRRSSRPIRTRGRTSPGRTARGTASTLKLTGPGEIIVTDTTPNDGVARRQHQHDHPGRHQPDEVGPHRHRRAVVLPADHHRAADHARPGLLQRSGGRSRGQVDHPQRLRADRHDHAAGLGDALAARDRAQPDHRDQPRWAASATSSSRGSTAGSRRPTRRTPRPSASIRR